MPLVTLKPVLEAARARGGYAMGLVCLSWEDAQNFVAAGEAAGTPVILQAGPGARRHMPVAIWGAMFRELGEAAQVPVVAHLDHGASLADCREALAAGFTSVMFDGSALPLSENMRISREVSELARQYGASVEVEVGIVGYSGGSASHGTDPCEAAAIAALDIDALAVSVGNVHLQDAPEARIDWQRAEEISAKVPVPLVIHGGSGVAPHDRARLARDHAVAKINVGTELRQTYGQTLRKVLADDATVYDRLAIARAVQPDIVAATAALMRSAWA